MRLLEIVKLMRTYFPELNIYPLEYPLKAPENSVLVDLQSNNPAVSGVYDVNVQFKVREVHPSLAEETSYKIRDFLENKTDFLVGSVQVVMVKSVNPVPLYMGRDTTGLYLYSNNFRFMINEGA